MENCSDVASTTFEKVKEKKNTNFGAMSVSSFQKTHQWTEQKQTKDINKQHTIENHVSVLQESVSRVYHSKIAENGLCCLSAGTSRQ